MLEEKEFIFAQDEDELGDDFGADAGGSDDADEAEEEDADEVEEEDEESM